ncbi:MAG: mannose-6-phosphate isomerase, type [Parcubacteria group bacterium]|nr:mannose-6-phosphate isomerase, type [Parcubacteria group bacterium]
MDKPFSIKRPWGEFREYAENEPVTVKTIFIKDGESLSLQYHEHRGEFWHILKGTPEVTIGGEKVMAKAGDEFETPPNVEHRIAAVGGDVEFLEIARGQFDEKDIVRTEDKYGRT